MSMESDAGRTEATELQKRRGRKIASVASVPSVASVASVLSGLGVPDPDGQAAWRIYGEIRGMIGGNAPWFDSLLRLARVLKAHRELGPLRSFDVVAFAEVWYAAVRPTRVEEGGEEVPVEWDEVRGCFRRQFDTVRFPACEALTDIRDQVVNDGPQSWPGAIEGYSPKQRMLAAICRQLERDRPEGAAPWFMSVRTASQLIGYRSIGVVSDYLKEFIADGLLSVVDKGSASTKKATRYRWTGPL